MNSCPTCGAEQWQPVEVLPPVNPSFGPHSIDVLVWDGNVAQAGFLIFADNLGNEARWSTPTDWIIDDVTHWMPFPQAPEVLP